MKKYIILFLKCICVMVPVIGICIYAKVYALSYADQEAPYYSWNKQICNEDQGKDYNVLILGDSASNAAYVPELLSDSTVNLSLGGTTPIENYYMLKEYLGVNALPKVVYMSFVDTHLNREDGFYSRIMYTHRFNWTELREIVERAKYYKEPSIITDSYVKDFWSYELYLPNKYITSIMSGSFNQRREKNENSINAVDLHQGRYISLGTAENAKRDFVTLSEFRVAPLFDEYYRKIIKLCADNNITVRIVKLPMDENALFTEEYENQFYAYYDQLQKEYANLTVDWIKGEYTHFHYYDLTHMNNHGARMFSTLLKERYSEDFSWEISDNQYAAFDDDILIETSCSELLQWISGKDYTIIMYDGYGDLEQIYEDELRSNTGLNIGYSGYDNIYFVSGTNSGIFHYNLDFIDGCYKITMANGTTYDWKPFTNKSLGVCIMNDRSGAQISIKNFERVKQSFVMR